LGTVTFAAGQTSRTIQIRVWGDTVLEHNETLSLELYNPTNGARLAGGVATLRAVGGIIEDDGNLPGTSGNDTILGTPFADSLSGLAGNDVLEGNDGHDTLSGGSGNDVLRGGDGIDTLDGGDGSDQIAGGRAPDRIDGGAGTDYASYASSSAGVSVNLLTGRGSSGDAQGDVLAGIENLLGSSFADVLTGNAGVNGLDGGAGADQMAGGAGNDTYVVDNAGDVVTEAAGAGADTVQASISWSIGTNLENLILIGAAALNGNGNSVANSLTGNAAANILNGGAGADQMAGGAGNDTYVVDNAGDVVTEAAGAGTDTVQASVSWTLGANLENLILTGAAAINGTGNGLANSLSGNAAANILNGGAGADQMAGGAGNDTYVVDNAGDVATEAAGAGTDTAQAAITWSLGANLENLTLLGSGAINGTGNALANVITGNSGANVLRGGAGADVLNGGGGSDTASYYVATVGVVVDLAAGTGSGGDAQGDVLVSIENVNGSLANDTIIGNAGANVLNGWAGRDVLTGGGGADRFVLSSASYSPAATATRDIITDFTRAQGDRIDLSAIDANTAAAGDQAFVFIGSALYSAAGQLRFAQVGGQTVVAGDLNGDGASDFHIALNGTIALLAADFVL
uniref:beta strand repeat-containing protein n=1 Tax=Inquilinus sp. OTU3971 TaxID=3043855 RepID=UPI00313DC09B